MIDSPDEHLEVAHLRGGVDPSAADEVRRVGHDATSTPPEDEVFAAVDRLAEFTESKRLLGLASVNHRAALSQTGDLLENRLALRPLLRALAILLILAIALSLSAIYIILVGLIVIAVLFRTLAHHRLRGSRA